MRYRAKGLLAVAVMLALAGCGGGSNAAAPVATTEAPAATPSRCEPVPADLVAGIATGLTKVSGGGTLRDAAAVQSADFESMYFVSAEIDGPGIESDGDVGTWATNRLEVGGGLIFAVNDAAKEFSDWGDGGTTDAQISMDDDGAEESQDCVRSK